MGRTIPGFIRPIAGLAIAASVAAVAILGIQAYRPGELSPSAEIAQGQPVRIERSNLEFGVPVSVPDRQVVQPVQLKIQSDARISRYILNHNEYQSRVGAQGVTPVSIFIEKVSTGEPVNSGSLNQDGVNVYSSSSGGIQVTAVGQVSDPTVKQIVESVLSTR
jgi:negative regulator of sigma E activity